MTATQARISFKLRYIVGFGLVEMAISTNPKPTIYRNLYENMAADEKNCIYSLHADYFLLRIYSIAISQFYYLSCHHNVATYVIEHKFINV